MGQSSLIMVLGAALLIGYMGVRMQGGSSSAMQNSITYYNKTYARNIATSAVEIYLKKLKDDVNIRGAHTITDIMDGKANITISAYGDGKIDTLFMRTDGIYNKDTVKIANILCSVTAPATQKFDGALGVTYNGRARFNLQKNTTLDGRNHDINGNLDTLSAPSVAGLTLGNIADSSDISKESTVKIRGKGSIEPNIAAGVSQPDRTTWIEQLKALADVTYSKKTVSKVETLGTIAKPQITYVNGNSKFNKDASGAGILIVEGDCQFSGDFTFTGLIIVIGDNSSKQSVKFNGNSKIVGSLMVVGSDETNKTQVQLKNQTDILYSAKALEFAQTKATEEVIARYEISEWFE